MAAVDEFDLAEASDDGGSEASPSGRPRRGRPWPWVATAAALVTVGSLNATPTPIVLGQPGIPFGLLTTDVRKAPELAWESELANSYVAAASDDALVLTSDDTGLDRDVLGLDPATGAELWHYHDSGYSCQWSSPVVCVEQPGTPEAMIIRIDTLDGTRQSQPYPDALAAVATGDALVVVEATETATESVVLIEADGSERWRVGAEAAQTEGGQFWVWLRIDDETISLDLSAGSIDLETGTLSSVANSWKLPDGSEIQFTAEGSMVLQTADRQIPLGPNEQLIPFDDDLGGPVMVEQASSTVLTASRRVDGAELWHLATPNCHPTARVRRTVAVQCWEVSNEQIIALDERTGDTLWELPNALLVSATADLLLVLDRTERTLLALDPTDGSPRWSVPVPISGYANVTELADGILVAGESGLIRLRWS